VSPAFSSARVTDMLGGNRPAGFNPSAPSASCFGKALSQKNFRRFRAPVRVRLAKYELV
jgi:hypothetical protein